MKKFLTLSLLDFQLIFRDKVLMIILFIPLIMILILRWAVPPFMESLAIDGKYYPIVVGVICVVTAISPAYLISFIMLDEKDENVLTVIRTLPLSPEFFISYRILFSLLFGFLSSLMILFISKLQISLVFLLLIAMQVSLFAPIAALVIVTYSRNKIEGLTFLKGINFLMILPILSFFSGSIGKIFMAFIPTFWIFHAFMNIHEEYAFFLYLFMGIIINIILLLLLVRQFKRKVF